MDRWQSDEYCIAFIYSNLAFSPFLIQQCRTTCTKWLHCDIRYNSFLSSSAVWSTWIKFQAWMHLKILWKSNVKEYDKMSIFIACSSGSYLLSMERCRMINICIALSRVVWQYVSILLSNGVRSGNQVGWWYLTTFIPWHLLYVKTANAITSSWILELVFFLSCHSHHKTNNTHVNNSVLIGLM